MTLFDQPGKMLEKQGQQQYLYVRTVDIGIGKYAYAAIAQARQIDRIAGTVGIHAYGHRNNVDFVVRKQPVAFDFPRIEHLAAQRQHRLKLDRKSTRLNSSHYCATRMPSSA